MPIIPPDKEPGALRMFARGDDDAEIHRYVWPAGTSTVSVGMLRTLLAHTAAAELRVEPSDELPTDLDEAVRDIVEARGLIMGALRAETPEGGEVLGTNPGLHLALVANVKAHIGASKHRIVLQAHEVYMREHGYDRARAGLATRRGQS